MIKNLEQYPIVREHNWNEEELIHFENKISVAIICSFDIEP